MTSTRIAFDQMAAGDLDLWCFRIAGDPAAMFPGSDAWLDPAERRRAERIADARARERYRVAHNFLRWVLASYLGCAENAVEIRRDARGKPRLAGPDIGMRFNLSHAHDLVAVAVARDTEVGVDLELTASLIATPWSSVFGLDAAFDEAEARAIGALPLPDARLEAVRLWTLKEALAKAVGEGIALPLRAAGFPLLTSEDAADRPLGYPGPWSFTCLPLGDSGWLSAAVAARQGRTRVPILAASPSGRAGDSVAEIRYAPRSRNGMPGPCSRVTDGR